MKKNKIIYLNGLIDLAQSRLGSKIVLKLTNFAPAKRIISPWPPVYKEGVLTNMVNGWMDGKQEEKDLKDMIF